MDHITRADWGARPPARRIEMPRSEGVFVHYRGPGGAPTGEAAKAALRQDQAYHMDVRGWSDIAYSWAVDNDGVVYELRGWGVTGGHTQGWNHRSHAVLWIGGDAAPPSQRALEGIAAVCREHHRRYGEAPIRGHRDVNPTSCPGDALYARLPEIRRLAAQPSSPQEDDDVKVTNLMARAGVDLFIVEHLDGRPSAVLARIPGPDQIAAFRSIFGVVGDMAGDQSALIGAMLAAQGGRR